MFLKETLERKAQGTKTVESLRKSSEKHFITSAKLKPKVKKKTHMC